MMCYFMVMEIGCEFYECCFVVLVEVDVVCEVIECWYVELCGIVCVSCLIVLFEYCVSVFVVCFMVIYL